MENKQTAVEWLVLYMETYFHLTDESREAFEKAKQMEKEQMLGFYTNQIFFDESLPSRFEQYYKETYGK